MRRETHPTRGSSLATPTTSTSERRPVGQWRPSASGPVPLLSLSQAGARGSLTLVKDPRPSARSLRLSLEGQDPSPPPDRDTVLGFTSDSVDFGSHTGPGVCRYRCVPLLSPVLRSLEVRH